MRRVGVGLATAAIALLAISRQASAATVTVTGTGDTVAVDGAVTLREAITSINNGANVNADVVAVGGYGSNDTIAFNIPGGAGPRIIAPASNLPALTRQVRIDGETQTTSQGNSNAVILGTGGTVGATGVALVPVDGPEIEIRGNGVIEAGLAVQANNIVIRNLAIFGFAAADIDIRQNSNAVTIENCVIGTPATSFTDPGAGVRSPGPHVIVSGGGVNNGVIRHNLVGFAGGRGLDLRNGSNFQVTGNEIRGNGIIDAQADGIDLAGSNSVNHMVQENLVADNGAFGIDIQVSNSQLTIQRNTISGNGLRGEQTAGIGIGGPDKKILDNVMTGNAGAGVLVTSSGVRATINRNQISGNGTLGIDLLTGSDTQNTGTPPYRTLNDQNDSDGGGNDLLNYLVLEEARISAGSLQISGWARPGSAIELFIADADPSGFGEGATYLVTRNEQSGDDQDTTSGSYGPGPINGIDQGTDNTNRFRFVIPLSSLPGVGPGTALTATATSANSTSEFSGRVVIAGAATLTLSGRVFEDVNYGGGPGRPQGDAAGIGRPGAIVELYDAAGAWLASTTTGAAGDYAFTNLTPAVIHSIRVVNGSVTSSRPGGASAGLFPVETYSADVATGRTLPRSVPGGAAPDQQDSGAKGPGGDLDDAAVEQSVTRVLSPAGVTSVSGLDFGFNFDLIVNRNDAGQGSLRQFMVNANTLLNTGLDQADTLVAIPPGFEASLFQVAGTGVLRIAPLSALPAITDGDTWIDGLTQPGTVPNTAATGTNAMQRIELHGAAAPGAAGLVFMGADRVLVRAVVVNGFAAEGVTFIGGTDLRVEGAFIGTDAAGTGDVGNGGDGVRLTSGATLGKIGGNLPQTRNVIAFNGRGVVVGATASGAATVILDNSIFENDGLGIDLGGDGVTLNDPGDADTGPNGLLNFPVLTSAVMRATALVVEGFAPTGSTIELFVTDPEPGGFGEGRTRIATLLEGALNDRDARSGTYGPIVNGRAVGSDTTSRFRFEINVVVPEGALLTATATLGGATSEFSGAQAVEFPADVSITIAAPPLVQPGTPIAYVVTVTNHGPGVATVVNAELIVPAGLTWQSTTGGCTVQPPCVFPTLAAGASASFTSTYLIAASYTAPNPILATAVAATASPDPMPGNNLRTASTLLPSADLEITKTELLTRSAPADPLTYRITVLNRGPDDASNVRVDDPTPAGVTFTGTSGACTTPFPCLLGTLPAQATAVIDVTYSVPFTITAPVVNVASVASTTPDPIGTNDTASASSPRRSSLSVSKTGPASTSPGQSMTYTIVVANGGPQGVAEVLVEDPTPAGLTFVSTSGACETAFPCVVGPLAAGRSATIVATYLVPDDIAPRDSIVNTVSISSAADDPNLDDNTATVAAALVVDPDEGDGDGMPDGWETCVGLDPSRNDAAEDPDGDGRSNLEELGDRTHPRGFAEHYLPEGSDNAFFLARFSLLNPDVAETAHVLVRMQPEGAPEIQACFPLGPLETTIMDPSKPTALRASSLGLSFATQFESDVPLVTERGMTWSGGGEHSDVSIGQLSDTWFFAEGATHGGFRIYYMLQNPALEPTTVEIVFLRADPLGPFVQTYTLAPRSRLTIFANAIPELLGTNLSAIVRVTAGGTIAAARAMYRDVDGVPLRAGTSVTAAPAPALEWFFAEGSVSTYFAEYLLILNPELAPATVDVTFLSDNGAAPVARQVVVPPLGRATVSIADFDPALVGSSTAVRVASANGVPIVVERSMWWPNDPAFGGFWTEGHASMGATATAPRWVFPGRPLPPDTDMFLFVANHGDAAGEVLIRFGFADGTVGSLTAPIGAQARATLRVNEIAPSAVGRSFFVAVDSLGEPLPLVVERALYRSDRRGMWTSGSVTLGAPLP